MRNKSKIKKITLEDGTELESEDLMDISELEEGDWRGIIAIILTVGVLILAGATLYLKSIQDFVTVMAILGPFVTMIIKDYFNAKK